MDNYETILPEEDEKEFKIWFAQAKENGTVHPEDNGEDYDFRGFWKDMIKNSDEGSDMTADTHFPDTYKKPNHETFSVESKYAKGKMKKYAGYWEGNRFIPAKKKYKDRDAADILYD